MAVASRAGAVCDQTSASTADVDLWNTHGCWNDYFVWEAHAYKTNDDDWGDRGFHDACNINLEYTKHWNAAYLISYGLADNPSQSFHSGQLDYQELARARKSDEWHQEFRHQAMDDTSFIGRYVPRSILINLVQTSCILYNSSVSNATPASRAGDFIHEGTHAWLDRQGYDPSHLTNPVPGGRCTASGANCDYFYFHGVGTYAFGAMHEQNGSSSRFHSPNQSQVELLCDVADQSQDWVPASVRIAAASDANTRAVQRFINGPGYSCGSPRPW